MTAASPGVISLFFHNDYYPSQGAYLEAIATAMKPEYETIVAAGFDLQVDCPDLAMGRHIQYANLELAEFRKRAAEHIEALNAALANIPADRIRMHLCWGNYEGPHHCDVPLADIVDIVLRARPAMLSLEAANPRHAHEFAVFEKVKLPAGKVLIPGVIEFEVELHRLSPQGGFSHRGEESRMLPSQSLLQAFSRLEDPRCRRGVRHPFAGMVVLMLLGMLARNSRDGSVGPLRAIDVLGPSRAAPP